MLHKRSAKIDNHKSKRMKIEKIFKNLHDSAHKQTEDKKTFNNSNAASNDEANDEAKNNINMNSQQISKFENGLYVNYNYLPKVNCTITHTKYIDDLVEYFVKWNYYKSLASSAKIFMDNDKMHNIIIKNMDPNKIVNVTTIYIDYPFYITIKINNKHENDTFKTPSLDFNLWIYRELLSKSASQIGQLEKILKTGDKEQYSENIMVDFYNMLIFLYKIVFDSDSSFTTKKELLCFIKHNDIVRSIYNNQFIHMKTITCMDSLLYLILENIQIEQH